MAKAKTFEDCFNMLCGSLLGRGIHRDVFECNLRPDLVVKVETGKGLRNFANIYEDRFWTNNQFYSKVADWLAPVKFISPDGRILLQQRARIATPLDPLPDMMPAFLTDFKPDNFGYIDSKLVCVDYSMALDNPNPRLKKVESWRISDS